MKKTAFLLVLSLILVGFIVPTYSDFPNEIRNLVDTYYKSYPIEKIYVQTDKNHYATGETIWLKAVMQYEDTTYVDSLSKVIYVELFDAAHKMVAQRTLQLLGNSAHGDILVPDSLASGQYELRGYTSWLRNFGEESFFHKTVTIFSVATKGTTNQPTTHTANKDLSVPTNSINLAIKPHLQFFPEGGDMVKLLRNHVAFKATDNLGRGMFVEGIIQDAQGKKCASFTSNA